MSDSVWDNIKGMVAGAAPALGTALGGPAGGAVGSMIAGALGVEDTPDAIQQALKSDPEAAVKLQKLQNEHERELRSMDLEARSKEYAQQHKTIRQELQSDNWYKSAWRPTIGWVLALSLGAIMGTLAYAIVMNPSNAASIMQAASGVLMFMAGLLGYNAKKRSDDKAMAAGFQPKGIGDAISGMFGKK